MLNYASRGPWNPSRKLAMGWPSSGPHDMPFTRWEHCPPAHRTCCRETTGIRTAYFGLGNRQNFIKSVVTLGTPYLGTTITNVVFDVSLYL